MFVEFLFLHAFAISGLSPARPDISVQEKPAFPLVSQKVFRARQFHQVTPASQEQILSTMG